MGAPVDKRYHDLINQYFSKKELKQRRAEVEVSLKATTAVQEVKQNRIKYEKIRSKTKLQSISDLNESDGDSYQRNRLSLENLGYQSTPESRSSIKKIHRPINRPKPQSQSQLGMLKDHPSQLNKNQRTSWSDLKQLNFQRTEESDIKVLLGIPQPKIHIREANGLGGGGNHLVRKEITLGRLENSRIPAGVRLKQLKNQKQLQGRLGGVANNPYSSLNTTATHDDADHGSLKQRAQITNQYQYNNRKNSIIRSMNASVDQTSKQKSQQTSSQMALYQPGRFGGALNTLDHQDIDTRSRGGDEYRSGSFQSKQQSRQLQRSETIQTNIRPHGFNA